MAGGGIWVGLGLPDVRPVELLRVARLQPWQELEAQQPTERERHRALAVRIDVLAIDLTLSSGLR